MILSVALEEEVADYLRCQRYERNQGSRRGYRNGHRERQVSCGAGEIEVAMPRVSDTQESFHSILLGAWQRRSRLLRGLTDMIRGIRIWLNQISTSYGTQPNGIVLGTDYEER